MLAKGPIAVAGVGVGSICAGVPVSVRLPLAKGRGALSKGRSLSSAGDGGVLDFGIRAVAKPWVCCGRGGSWTECSVGREEEEEKEEG